ncbi:hypothetical protein CPAR01_06887 [Colletotrichum paranaense]|uniref:Uncharacterized protein n=4 Tax=Colletotrichum acutatum species complex TaxID=2707335 RepID=A0AAI9UXL1_9PEZI|nr:uncharacterized protein CPAR01_06887 [Colletotrichum paranaense]XP_060374896.1 uncharacterized protein CTAM01_14517 [Colletotrichum tamarilloi]KAI3534927.1 hypothetical protein CSPX01_11780 [Colletotrichum filicis]KAK0371718.1 hypothetical protein CLIM01_10924 [Colletotrichum limetticola]KAK1464854.1 hypothetical protein CMEL01_12209 [Colletotrichum melonis]KAK1479770.1 hypothetical protein CTAM01_14517 [Colletotrichum tamarilloi]KAK1540898.1 hypothetical protein CPAR01_06887 [Colletotrich
MFTNTQRLLSAFAATALLFATSSSAAAVQPRQGPGPVNDWISVDSNGNARTISPSVVTSNGARTTISPPPYSLTGSVYTVTATTGGLTTSTGVPPPPQASNTQGFGGVFAVCNNRVGQDGPFCQPRRGSTLHVESTYYITWDTTFFADPATPIGIVGFDVDNGITDNAPAFSVTNLSGGDGWVPWTPHLTDLESKTSNNMTIILMYNDPDTGEEKNLTGPVFTLRMAMDTDAPNSRPNLLAILLPVILISLAIAAFMVWLYIRRRRRHAAVAAAVERQNAAHPTGQPRSMHGQKGSADIQLEPTSPPPGSTPGRNVFQEEVRRQERERA